MTSGSLSEWNADQLDAILWCFSEWNADHPYIAWPQCDNGSIINYKPLFTMKFWLFILGPSTLLIYVRSKLTWTTVLSVGYFFIVHSKLRVVYVLLFSWKREYGECIIFQGRNALVFFISVYFLSSPIWSENSFEWLQTDLHYNLKLKFFLWNRRGFCLLIIYYICKQVK